MEIIRTLNLAFAVLFFLCYLYQFFYIPLSLAGGKKYFTTKDTRIRKNRYALLIAARNEEKVIGHLLDSISGQTYPRELITAYVVADNCTDATAYAAKAHGARVYERFNRDRVGKGYALEFLLSEMEETGEIYDGYFVFDADNILEPDYIAQMDKVFSDGNDIVTSYRNSKNYGDNWISAGYALWFLREARYLNHPRRILGTSCAVSGTGFMFSRRILEKQSGWKFHLLTEDIEFTVANILSGEKISYCPDAVFYDEQPVTFAQSWRQRLRWARGYLQVFIKYGKELIKGVVGKNGFSCFDMTMSIMPAAVISVLSSVINVAAVIFAAVTGRAEVCLELMGSLASSLIGCYLTLFAVGAITAFSERKRIKASAGKKILYTFTFPLFMFTYIPITIASFFGKVTWKPIEHRVQMSIEEMRKR